MTPSTSKMAAADLTEAHGARTGPWAVGAIPFPGDWVIRVAVSMNFLSADNAHIVRFAWSVDPGRPQHDCVESTDFFGEIGDYSPMG